MLAESAFLSRFPHYLPRGFVIPERNKLGVPQLTGPGPFGKINWYDHLRFQPDATLHFLRGQALSPSPFGDLRLSVDPTAKSPTGGADSTRATRFATR